MLLLSKKNEELLGKKKAIIDDSNAFMEWNENSLNGSDFSEV